MSTGLSAAERFALEGLLAGHVPVAEDERGQATQVYDVRGFEVGEFWSEYHVPGHYDLTIDQDGY